MPAAMHIAPRPRSQYVQRQKSDTTDIVAGNSRPLAGQVLQSQLNISSRAKMQPL